LRASASAAVVCTCVSPFAYFTSSAMVSISACNMAITSRLRMLSKRRANSRIEGKASV
jgi:hypothetical protein